MLETVLLDKALCLPADDIAALLSGKLIAALPRVPVQKGWSFALFPYVEAIVADCYRSNFAILTNTSIPTSTITAWATCEQCMMLHSLEEVEALSCSTIWQKEALKLALEKRQHLFLAILRVYRTPELINVNCESLSVDKFGKFIGLFSLDQRFKQPEKITHKLPVLSDRIFAQRKRQLENLEPPEHPEIEALHSTIAQLSHPKALLFAQQIAEFLGWSEPSFQSNPDLTWIRTINDLATRSKEPDDAKKSNYQAGTDFEIVTRQGLAYLGFKVEEDYRGGAGGLDLFCSEPYPLVGECKSGKSITDRAVEELDRIGRRHLQENYTKATRLIIGPGSPTTNLQASALISKTSILGAMTFQKLVELQAQYPGSVNLIELRNCLKPGQSDEAIEQYINTVSESIQLRSHIVQVVRDCLEKLKTDSAGVSEFHTAYVFSAPPCSLDPKELHEILLELASPLTGYLGRIKGNQWENDRFYFLRPFHLNTTT